MNNLKQIYQKYKLTNFHLGLISLPFVVSAILLFTGYLYKKSILNQILPYLNISDKYMIQTEIPNLPEIKMNDYKFVNNLINKLYEKPKKKLKRKVVIKKNIKIPSFKISYIYIGVNNKYAFVNGKLLKEGDKLTESIKVIKIEKNRILIKGNWGRKWFYLIKN